MEAQHWQVSSRWLVKDTSYLTCVITIMSFCAPTETNLFLLQTVQIVNIFGVSALHFSTRFLVSATTLDA